LPRQTIREQKVFGASNIEIWSIGPVVQPHNIFRLIDAVFLF